MNKITYDGLAASQAECSSTAHRAANRGVRGFRVDRKIQKTRIVSANILAQAGATIRRQDARVKHSIPFELPTSASP
jgi:hypothetical protein